MQDAVAHLVGQHQDLAAVVRLVRKHVSEHGPSGGPRLRPAAARELRNAAIRHRREGIRNHTQALRGTLAMRGSRLLHRTAVGIERLRTLQMRRGIFQPHQTAVVQMREDRRDGPPAAFFARRLRAPRARV